MRAKYINEKFTEDGDPIEDMGIGLRHEIKEFLKKYHIKNYRINKDGTISIKGNLNFDMKDIKTLPDYINFRYVSGNFIGSYRMQSMKGFPRRIKGNFQCGSNNFKSLDNIPEYVGGFFSMHNKFSEEQIRNKCVIKGFVLL